jgi:serine phosphatase RsbU (regulator of sigma subunit)
VGSTQPPALRVTFPGTGRPAAAFPAAEGVVVAVGRPSSAGPAPDVALQDASVSRRHAEFAWSSGRWQVRSVGKGGSSLDGQPLAAEAWTPFPSGATLAIGPYRMRLVLGDAAATVAETLMLDDGIGDRAEAIPRQRLESAEVRLSALIAAARRIGAADELDALAEAVVHALAESGDFDRAFLVRGGGGVPEGAGAAGDGTWTPIAAWAASEHVRALPVSRTLLAEAARTASTVQASRAGAAAVRMSDSLMASGATTAMCAPVPAHDPPRVFLYADTRAGGRLGDAAVPYADMVAQLAGLAIAALERREDRIERERLEREIDVARRIQAGTFPSGYAVARGWEIAAESRPADSCGGDAFDVVPMRGDAVDDDGGDPDGYVLSIADATDHGVASALSSVQVRAMLRLGLRTGRPIVRIAEQVNAQLCRDLPDGRNVTAWFARLDAATGEVHAVSAGQGPILVYRRATDAFEVHGADQPPLGVVPVPYDDAESRRFRLGAGDLLVALTDGYFEAPAAVGGDRFGDARVMEAVRGARDGPAHEVLEALKRAVEAFTGGAPLEDDRTALVVRRVP